MSSKTLIYTFDELRPIRSSIDRCRLALIKFIEHYKSVDLLDVECRLLNRCVYKNWNARHAELGIQSTRRTVRFSEQFLSQRVQHLDEILESFQPDQVIIRLPSRGTLNQLRLHLEQTNLLLKKIQAYSKLTIGHLRRECGRTNYVQYNILIMSLCARLHYLSLSLEKSQEEFIEQIRFSIKSFKKKVNMS